MGRKKLPKDELLSNGMVIVVILLIYIIYNSFWFVLLLACIAVAVALVRFMIKKKKRAEYLRQFYDRERRVAELNADEFIDVALTDAIRQAARNGSVIEIGKDDAVLKSIKDAYELVMQSESILQANTVLSNQNSGRALTETNGILVRSEPMVLRYAGENNGGYVFYVFAETILIFIEGIEKSVFIAAYKPTALTLSCSTLKHTLHPQIIMEKTQHSIRYYDKYCPVKDAQIISSHWAVTNKDGSRSFRGGLLPQNNPLYFTLKYGQLTVKLGDYSVNTSFSRYDAVLQLIDIYNKLKNSEIAD